MAKHKAAILTQKIITNNISNLTKQVINATATTPASSQAIMGIYNLISSLFAIANAFLLGISYVLLIFQTVYVLNTIQPKYINLRHIALKWIICLAIFQIKQGFSNNTDLNSHLANIFLDCFLVFIAYPSKVLKAIHLKYFSHKEQQKYQQSVIDPHKYDLTFWGRFYLNICVLLLNILLPQHRRPIEQVLRSINTVIIERKCFWSIYETQKKASQQETVEKEKISTRDFLVSGASVSLPTISLATSLTNIPNLPIANLKTSNLILPSSPRLASKRQTKEVIKAYGQKCSNITVNGYKPIKRVSLRYIISTSELQITDLDFAKSDVYILQELNEKMDNVIEFVVVPPGQKKSEQIYIKFKNSKELEVFMKDIEMAEKVF